MTPLVSVCVPVRNGAPYLADALASVLRQSMRDFELIVSDNASTDGSAELADALGDSRVQVLRNPSDIGGIPNWNRATAAARGRYVKMMAADDLLYPDALLHQVAVLEEPANEGVVLVASKRDIIDEHGRRIARGRGLGRLDGRIDARRAVRLTVRSGSNPWGEPHCVLFRAAALPGEGAFSAERAYMVDVDLWCRLLRHGDAYALRQTVGAFRVHVGAESTRLARDQAGHAEAFFRSLEESGLVTTADRRAGVAKARVLAAARRNLYRTMRITRRASRAPDRRR